MSIFLLDKTYENYKPSRIPQRRNPVYSHKFTPKLCWYCEKNVNSVKGRNSHYRTLNQIWGHFLYDHPGVEFKPYLMNMADKIISGELR